MATGIQISPSSDITVGTTAISNGTEGRVLFQGAGNVVQQDAGLFWDNTLKRLRLIASGTASTDIPFAIRDSSNSTNLLYADGNGDVFLGRSGAVRGLVVGGAARTAGMGITSYTPISIKNNQGLYIERSDGTNVKVLDYSSTGFNLTIGAPASSSGYIYFNKQNGNTLGGWDVNLGHFTIGATTAGARLDVCAQGALSTDIAFRVRNSADTIDLLSFRGTGGMVNRMNTATEWWQTSSADGVHRWEIGFTGNLPFMSLGGQDGKPRFGYKAVTDAREFALGLKGGYSNFALGETFASGTVKPNEANTNTMYVFSGVSPTLSAVDSFSFYSKDIVAGNAAPHFRTEAGNIIKLYTETTAIGGAGYVDGVDDPIRKDTTINGYTLDQVVKALQNFGLLA
jgi:hypothetical protein